MGAGIKKHLFLLKLVERLHTALGDADDFAVIFVIEFHKEVVYRIDPHAVMDNFVVQVRGERQAAVARLGDDIAAPDALALFDIDFAQVAV